MYLVKIAGPEQQNYSGVRIDLVHQLPATVVI